MECQQRFTYHNNYNRHVAKNRCTSGQPKLVCLGKKFMRIMNALEKVFHGRNTQLFWKACRWIKHQSELIGHALCSHGGERCMVINKNEIFIDVFDSETSIIYQFYRCKWHSCPCLGNANDKYHRTMAIENQFRGLGYNVVSVWESSHPEGLSLTSDLMINRSHILISVAINDRLTQELIFLHNQDPEQFIKEFIARVRWKEIVFDKVVKIYLMVDEYSLPSRVLSTWTNWLSQVPVL